MLLISAYGKKRSLENCGKRCIVSQKNLITGYFTMCKKVVPINKTRFCLNEQLILKIKFVLKMYSM